jgi:hypothetical protein
MVSYINSSSDVTNGLVYGAMLPLLYSSRRIVSCVRLLLGSLTRWKQVRYTSTGLVKHKKLVCGGLLVGELVGFDVEFLLPDEMQTPELSSHLHKLSLLHFFFVVNDRHFEWLIVVGCPVG